LVEHSSTGRKRDREREKKKKEGQTSEGAVFYTHKKKVCV